MYAFGALLIYSGIKLLGSGKGEIHPEKNPVLRLFRRFFRLRTNMRVIGFSSAEGHGAQLPCLLCC